MLASNPNVLLGRQYGVIMAHAIMSDPIRVSLRYRGPEVDNGEMDVQDVIEALEGFSNAYGKVANDINPDASYQLKVTALKHESFDLFIVAFMYLAQHGNVVKEIETLTNAAKYVYDLIADVIRVRKHTKGQPYQIAVKGNNNPVTIINAENLEINAPLASFELFQSGLIDRDLAKLVNPLRKGKIDVAELRGGLQPEPETTISAEEKEYFKPSSTITLKETELVGSLISLNKESNRGLFKFGDNSGVRYHYTGDQEEQFHRDFVRKGPVRVRAVVEFDENLKPLHIDIQSVEPLQRELKLTQ